MKKTFGIFLIAILLGCSPSGPTPPLESGWRPDTVNADYGQYPSNYESVIKQWYMANLKDPNSATFVGFTDPQKDHAIKNQFEKTAMFGYSVCASVNAKNSYGGYTGAQTKWFLIRNGTVVTHRKHPSIVYIGRPTTCAAP